MLKAEHLIAQQTPILCSIHPEAHLAEALKMLDDNHLEVLLVVDECQQRLGLVSKHDISYAYSTSQGKAHQMRIQDLLRPQEQNIVAQKSDDIRDILSVMIEKSMSHLPIIHEDKVLAVVYIDDVVDAFVAEIASTMIPNMFNEIELIL